MQKRGRETDQRFRRASGLEVREVGDKFFLAVKKGGNIHHLDRLASAAWRALAEPRTPDEIIGLFQAAFPDTPKRKIVKDVADLFAFLEENGLIVRAD